MARIAVLDRAADRRAARKEDRERARALKAHARRGRRAKAVKAVGCIALLAAFAALGLLVGTDDYQVTFVGWAPFVMTLLGIGLAAAYVRVLKGGITFEERLSLPECERDSDVTFTMRFKNASPLFATRMVSTFFICDMFGNAASESSTSLTLAPFEEYDLPLTTRFEHIGTFTAGLKEIAVSDFLGLFTCTIANQANQVVRVAPKVVELSGIGFSSEAMDEATKAARSVLADSMDYAYVREYELGDPLKTIHWKLSARSGQYMTRLFEVYTNPSVVIVMDFYADNGEADDLMSMFDAVVESAFSLVRYAQKKGMDAEVRFLDRHGREQALCSLDRKAASDVIADLPAMSNDAADAAGALGIIERQVAAARGFNNVFVCTANVGADMVSALVEAKVRRRSPQMIACVPPSLAGREREKHCANLAGLESSGIPYSVIARASELGVIVEGGR